MQQMKKHQTQGAALIITIFFFVVISVAIIQSATTGVISELRTYRSLVASKSAYIAAEAGIEDLYYRTLTNKQLPSSNSETLTLNGAASTVTINNISSSEKEFYSTGNASQRIRKLYLKTSKTSSAVFLYGAQVGRGGINMSNGAAIVATALGDGNVYSNGQISGQNTSSITGNATVASGILPDATASSTLCDTGVWLGGVSTNGVDYAQSFIMTGTTSDTLAKVSLEIRREGVPAQSFIYITPDAGGAPSMAYLTKQYLDYNLVGWNTGWVDVVFSNPPTLNPGTKYWIVFDASPGKKGFWFWCESSGAVDNYPNGSGASTYDFLASTPWSPISGDLAFRVYFGSGISLIDSVTVSGTAKADTINNSAVGGDGYYQTKSGTTVISGTSYPGSPTPPELNMPISSSTIAQWKSDAAAGSVINGNCGTGGVAGCNTFPLTLKATKINGNLTVDNGGVLTVAGTLYVTGSINVSNNGTIQCALGYLNNSCVIVTDGSVSVSNNGILAGSGSSGSYILLLSTIKNCLWRVDLNAPNCAPYQTGIYVANNVTGGLFYTTDSAIYLDNNAVLKAVIGYMLVLSNNTQIIYDSLVKNVSFAPESGASTGAGAWNVNRWNEY